MTYNIELSFKLTKFSNLSELENMVILLAQQNLYDHIYKFTETDGTTKIPRYHEMITVIFSNEKIDSLLQFIRNIKMQRQIHIESVYYEDTVVKLIYASGYYLQNIDKDIANKYRLLKRDRNYSEYELKIVNEFIN